MAELYTIWNYNKEMKEISTNIEMGINSVISQIFG